MSLQLVFATTSAGAQARTKTVVLSRAFVRKCGGKQAVRSRCEDAAVVEKLTKKVGSEMAASVLVRLARHDARLPEGGALALAMMRSKRDKKGLVAPLLQSMHALSVADVSALLAASMTIACAELTEFFVAYLVSESLDLDAHACACFADVHADSDAEAQLNRETTRNVCASLVPRLRALAPEEFKGVVEAIQTYVKT